MHLTMLLGQVLIHLNHKKKISRYFDMIGVYHAEIVDSLGCTANVELEITGMSELSLSSFYQDRNPFHNEFLVTPKAGGSMVLSYQIMDAAGKLIIDVNNMTSGIITVDASKLAGCYQLRLNTLMT